MTEQPTNLADSPRTIDAVMKRVGAAARHFELEAIRFIDCRFSYTTRPDGNGELRIGISEQEVSLDDESLRISMLFEFLAASPFSEDQTEQEKQVAIRAKLSVEYAIQGDRGQINPDEADTFGRVNGIYNAWPYLREYLQSSLVRLGLPPFELPLLRIGAAAQLAGLVDSPKEATPLESAPTTGAPH